MTEPAGRPSQLRAGLVEALRNARAVEAEVFGAIDPSERDAPGADGGWSAKDILAHLSAWRQRQAERLAGRHEGREDPPAPDIPIDELNAQIQAERAGWTWDQVVADAELTAEALIAEASAAGNDALTDPKTVGSIMVDGPEHDLGHLARVAAGTGLESRVAELAETTRAIIDRGGWPSRAAAIARYNLACFHALNGDLDVARSLLRQALPEEEELRTLAPRDADLTVLWDEIPTLAAGRP
jgi:hypothetical protein